VSSLDEGYIKPLFADKGLCLHFRVRTHVQHDVLCAPACPLTFSESDRVTEIERSPRFSPASSSESTMDTLGVVRRYSVFYSDPIFPIRRRSWF
jgi:hypothetical protein